MTLQARFLEGGEAKGAVDDFLAHVDHWAFVIVDVAADSGVRLVDADNRPAGEHPFGLLDDRLPSISLAPATGPSSPAGRRRMVSAVA